MWLSMVTLLFCVTKKNFYKSGADISLSKFYDVPHNLIDKIVMTIDCLNLFKQDLAEMGKVVFVTICYFNVTTKISQNSGLERNLTN